MGLTQEQENILKNESKNLVVSASAGSGKTFVLIEKLIDLICEKNVPLSRLLVLTFTKAAAKEMKSRLYSALLDKNPSPFILEQIDDISISDISTIDSFCEKIIKRNISKLSIDEGFIILDEKSTWKLKKRAFASAYEKFCKDKQFDTIYFSFKKNKERIEECIYDMQAYFDSLADQDAQKNAFIKNIDGYLLDATAYLKKLIFTKIESAKKCLNDCAFYQIPEKCAQFIDSLKSQLEIVKDYEFFQLCEVLNNLQIMDLPRCKMELELKKLLAKSKELTKDAISIAEHYKNVSEKQKSEIEKCELSKALLQLYKEFENKYSHLKEGRSALDFADIERYAKELLTDEEIKKGLQSRYDYIFIDEYQDTNRLQESILKPIAQGGHFVAVGDIKQGIYGFRNASKEIMQQDIENFSRSTDGEALYLTGNFRTDDKILSFVNDVFIKLMTDEAVGINYEKTSMLQGLRKFENGLLPAVSVDIVDNSFLEKEEAREGIYSVKEDKQLQEGKFKNELLTIASRVEECLKSQIYDAKKECFRNVEQGDIAILFRGRSALMQECVKDLQDRGFAVSSDIKNSLLDDGHIRILNSLLKLTLNLKDDISLASVMNSIFGKFSLEELNKLRFAYPDIPFYEIVLSSQDEKIQSFLEMIQDFAFNIQIFGIIKSLQLLFNRLGFIQYLKSIPGGKEKIIHINEFFKLIRSIDSDFKPMSVISALEQNSKDKSGVEGGGDCITITTIHATKGLEYPIVFLCGAGESLSKIYNKNYILTSKFGLGSQIYDFDTDSSLPSPIFLAGKYLKSQEEFESELMIFYVALTRAQNHLFIIGSAKKKSFTFDDLSKQNNYLKLILFALGENFANQLFECDEVVTNNRRFNVLTQFEESTKTNCKNIFEKNNYQEKSQKLQKFCEFSYKNLNNCKFNFKNSVSGVLKLNEDEYISAEFSGDNISRDIAIKRGNAYHEALRFIDFEKVHNLKTLKQQIESVKNLMQNDYYSFIEETVLLNNILKIKGLLNGQKIFKEQEFIMKNSLQEIGLCDDEENFVIVQGIVDFFAIGEKNILIDYKYTSTRDEDVLIGRYKKQIELYCLAIEKAFNIKIDEKYLLSLKYSNLIKL